MKYLGDVVVVDTEIYKQKQVGSIHIPSTVEGNLGSYTGAIKAEVLAIGKKVKCPELKVGDAVLVPNHLGTSIEVEGRKVRVYDFEDVIAIV